MDKYTLLFMALFAFGVALIYTYIGRELARRQLSGGEAKLAWQLFVIWWFGLAVTTFIGGLTNLLGLLGLTSLPLFVALNHLNLLSVCVALWGLLYYLIYLFTGRKKSLLPLSIFYVAYYLILVYYISASKPIGVSVERWYTGLQYEHPLTGPFFVLVLVFLICPQIIGSLAYFSLYFKVQGTTQRYRVLLVSWSIILWFSSALLASLTGFAEQDWWQITSRIIGLAAALTIYMAYFPPAWLKQRYSIASITNQM